MCIVGTNVYTGESENYVFKVNKKSSRKKGFCYKAQTLQRSCANLQFQFALLWVPQSVTGEPYGSYGHIVGNSYREATNPKQTKNQNYCKNIMQSITYHNLQQLSLILQLVQYSDLEPACQI